jgi:hypothetical protein
MSVRDSISDGPEELPEASLAEATDQALYVWRLLRAIDLVEPRTDLAERYIAALGRKAEHAAPWSPGRRS